MFRHFVLGKPMWRGGGDAGSAKLTIHHHLKGTKCKIINFASNQPIYSNFCNIRNLLACSHCVNQKSASEHAKMCTGCITSPLPKRKDLPSS